MEARRDNLDLNSELRALRPSPRIAFTDELDARVAAGFAETDKREEGVLGRIAGALRSTSPRQLALPAGAVTFSALVIATAVIAIGEENPSSSRLSGDRPPAATSKSAGGTGEASAGVAVPAGPSAGHQIGGAPQALAGAGQRDIERDAELVLRTQPDEIGKASREVFGAVHAANGVVLSSSVRDQGGESSARFQLLVPSARLGDTLASLSRIAEVRARHESTLDITAPTVSVGDRLKDSEATIDGMLTQLGAAESYEERTLLERQLRQERQRAAVLRSQLDRLHQRARFARVSVLIEGSRAGNSGSGTWGVDDALRDAGRILAIAAGVAVVSLAVIGPLALILLLAWLAQRIWLRQRRQRVLS